MTVIVGAMVKAKGNNTSRHVGQQTNISLNVKYKMDAERQDESLGMIVEVEKIM